MIRSFRCGQDLIATVKCGKRHYFSLECGGESIVNPMFEVQGFYLESPGYPMRLAVDTSHQAITIHDWQAEIAELTFRFGQVALDLVVEVKQISPALALNHCVIEG